MTTPAGHGLADIERETGQGIALADAAVVAAVPHVVFSSVGGAERDSGVPHFESKRRVEEHLEKSGLRGTVEIARDELTGSQIAAAFGRTPGSRPATKPCPCTSSGTTRMRRRCSAGSRKRPPTRPTSVR
jgi:hypothetical protein